MDKPDQRGPFDLNSLLSRPGADWQADPVQGADRDALDPVKMPQAIRLLGALMTGTLETMQHAREAEGKSDVDALPAPVAFPVGIHRTGVLVPLAFLDVDPDKGGITHDTRRETDAFIAALNRGDPAALAHIAAQMDEPDAVGVAVIMSTITGTIVGTGETDSAARDDAVRQMTANRLLDSPRIDLNNPEQMAAMGTVTKTTMTVTLYTPFHAISAVLDVDRVVMPKDDRPGVAPVKISTEPGIVPPFRAAAVQAAYWSRREDETQPR